MPVDLANGDFFLIEEDDERRTIVRDMIARGARVGGSPRRPGGSVLTAEALMRESAEDERPE